MDPRDGHRECPACLGRAHVVRDVEDPCDAALDLPYAERARRAAQAGHAPPPTQESGRERDGRHSRKRHRHRSPECDSGRPREHSSRPSKRSARDQEVGAAPGVAQREILAAIQSLSERMGRFEAAACSSVSQGAVPSVASSFGDTPIPEGDSDVLYLHAPASLTGSGFHSGRVSGSGSRSVTCDGEPGSAPDVSASESLLSHVLSAAKIVGVTPPAPKTASVEGVYKGVSQARPALVVPEAPGFSEMLMTNWGKPTSDSLFNAGCRGLAKMDYPLESGLGAMPPVEQAVAALTSLGPGKVSADSRCPNAQCEKTDRLVCRTYNSAARAARSGNALVLLLAALDRTIGAEDTDSRALINAAVLAHSQLTRDIGATMASAVVARRQVWLAQTTLPSNVRKELREHPVVPGHVFHPGFQEVLDRAERCVQTRESVRRFHQPVSTRFGSRRSYKGSGSRHGSWGHGRHQDAAFQASGAHQFRQQYEHTGQRGSAPRSNSRGGPHGRRSHRGAGRQGGSA